MQQSPANLSSVKLSGCFLKLLVSTASWGKVLQSLMTRCVKSLCLSFVFHLLPPPFTLCPGSCPGGTRAPIVPSLLPCDTRVWFMDLCPTPPYHFISRLFCLVIPGGEADPHLWSSLWPFPEPFPVQIYPFWRQRNKTAQGIQGAVTWKIMQCHNNNFSVFSLKTPLFYFPYWWPLATKPVFMWQDPHKGLCSRGIIVSEIIILYQSGELD